MKKWLLPAVLLLIADCSLKLDYNSITGRWWLTSGANYAGFTNTNFSQAASPWKYEFRDDFSYSLTVSNSSGVDYVFRSVTRGYYDLEPAANVITFLSNVTSNFIDTAYSGATVHTTNVTHFADNSDFCTLVNGKLRFYNVKKTNCYIEFTKE